MWPAHIVVSALLAASASAVAVNIKVHSTHNMKFREVSYIKNNAVCPNGGNVLMCESPSYTCQNDGKGTRKCLPRDDSFLDSVDGNTTISWAECSMTDASKPSKCINQFQCICHDILNTDCYCMPPDAWRSGRGNADDCTTSSGETNACDKGKYCRTHDGQQECAVLPYPPKNTSLFSDCTSDGKCDADLTCKEYEHFSICVDKKD